LKQVFIKILYNSDKEKRRFIITMDNRNIYNNLQQPNGYYPSYYAATAPTIRTDVPAYMMPQPAPAAIIKGRPVSSLEEARVAQIDLDGSVSIFPDLGNKKIYTKRINADGTATLHTYSLDEQVPVAAPEYVTKDEIGELKKTLDDVLFRLSSINQTPAAAAPATKPVLNF
jgi:hypothetical protein